LVLHVTEPDLPRVSCYENIISVSGPSGVQGSFSPTTTMMMMMKMTTSQLSSVQFLFIN